jgi:hypothetical protein
MSVITLVVKVGETPTPPGAPSLISPCLACLASKEILDIRSQLFKKHIQLLLVAKGPNPITSSTQNALGLAVVVPQVYYPLAMYVILAAVSMSCKSLIICA